MEGSRREKKKVRKDFVLHLLKDGGIQLRDG